jgi:hypothetical protein
LAIGASVVVGLTLSGCAAQSERDKYSYDAIRDDAFAQDKYMMDQGFLVDSKKLKRKGAKVQSWVALQTQQICDQLASGTTFDDLVAFFGESFGDVVTDAERFVGNAAGYSCAGHLD